MKLWIDYFTLLHTNSKSDIKWQGIRLDVLFISTRNLPYTSFHCWQGVFLQILQLVFLWFMCCDNYLSNKSDIKLVTKFRFNFYQLKFNFDYRVGIWCKICPCKKSITLYIPNSFHSLSVLILNHSDWVRVWHIWSDTLSWVSEKMF